MGPCLLIIIVVVVIIISIIENNSRDEYTMSPITAKENNDFEVTPS